MKKYHHGQEVATPLSIVIAMFALSSAWFAYEDAPPLQQAVNPGGGLLLLKVSCATNRGGKFEHSNSKMVRNVQAKFAEFEGLTYWSPSLFGNASQSVRKVLGYRAPNGVNGPVQLQYASWTDTRIVVDGFGPGYGGPHTVSQGDNVSIYVQHAGGPEYTVWTEPSCRASSQPRLTKSLVTTKLPSTGPRKCASPPGNPVRGVGDFRSHRCRRFGELRHCQRGVGAPESGPDSSSSWRQRSSPFERLFQ